MIVFRIRELAEQAGLKTAYQLQTKMKVAPGTASRWWNNPELKHIDSASLDRLCEFFGCEPGDIIKRVPDRTVAGEAKTPSGRKSGK